MQGAVLPRRRDRVQAWLLRRDRGGDPRARRALGRSRPAAGFEGRGDPVRGEDSVPGADGGGLSLHARCRAACRVAARRSGQWFDPELVAALLSFRGDDASGRSLRRRTYPRSSRPTGSWSPTRSGWIGSPRGSREVIDAKSRWTHEHCDRACTIALGIAAQLGFEDAGRRDLGRAARLHDIGKLSISNRILDKRGPLTASEWRRVKRASAGDRADS